MHHATIEGANIRSIAGPVHAPATNPKPLAPLNRSLVVTAVLAGLIVAATFWLVARNQSDAALVVRSLAVRDELTKVVSQVETAETGQRGYLLTGRDSYLSPYKQAVEALPASLDRLAGLVSDDPVSNGLSPSCGNSSKANSTNFV